MDIKKAKNSQFFGEITIKASTPIYILCTYVMGKHIHSVHKYIMHIHKALSLELECAPCAPVKNIIKEVRYDNGLGVLLGSYPTALYCTSLHFTSLHCIYHYTARHCTALHCTFYCNALDNVQCTYYQPGIHAGAFSSCALVPEAL